MIRINVCILVIMLTCTKASGQSPLWDSVGSGFECGPRMFYVDSVTDKLYTSATSAYTMDGLPIHGVASWDGVKWDSLGGGFEPLGPWGGNCIGWYANAAVRYNGKLYFGGGFQAADGKPIKWLATWDGVQWDSLPTSPNYPVGDLIVYHGKLYVCGAFTAIGGNTSLHRVARWDGSSWEAVGDIYQVADPTALNYYKFCIYNDELYLAGSFYDNNNNPRHIVKWNDTTWSYVGNGIQQGGICNVRALAVYNNELWIGGTFSAAATGTSNNITRWDGSQFKSVGGYGADGPLWSLHVHDNKLYAGGNTFWSMNGIPATGIAVFDGQEWCSLGTDLNAAVLCMATYHDSLIIGGGLSLIAGDTLNNIAMWVGGNYVDSCKNANIGFEESSSKIKTELLVFPNPNSGNFSLQFSNDVSEVAIRIYDNLGKLILVENRSNITANTPTLLTLPESTLGLYLLSVETDSGFFTQRIVVE